MSMTDWPADEWSRENVLAHLGINKVRHLWRFIAKKIAPEGAIFVCSLGCYKRLTICCLTLDYVNDIYSKRLA
jgi:hypothetical protein